MTNEEYYKIGHEAIEATINRYRMMVIRPVR